ncbi:hypothetical protein CY34DRAFT_727392 [Suillus luteus UH-Slu-Lm8-n1]|uniref:Uncharacterized protein n=1 Tax=Suillus luteus UH-Slu-Lm8-n1 TaxID=930992 RepID=A0A0D0AMA3_9AGAM|nr:hypothetical protein CY34DRAFT_727392 [Suillus luteus UH-Slu-Lm8-n1]
MLEIVSAFASLVCKAHTIIREVVPPGDAQMLRKFWRLNLRRFRHIVNLGPDKAGAYEIRLSNCPENLRGTHISSAQ